MESTDFNIDNYLKETEKGYIYHLSKIEEHKKQAQIFENLLRVLSGNPIDKETVATTLPDTKTKITKKRKYGKPTFQQLIIKCFADGVPKTTAEIREYIRKATGKETKSSNVSSQLISLSVKKIINSFKKSERVNIWGLYDWFIEGHLQDEYFEKFEKTKAPLSLGLLTTILG